MTQYKPLLIGKTVTIEKYDLVDNTSEDIPQFSAKSIVIKAPADLEVSCMEGVRVSSPDTFIFDFSSRLEKSERKLVDGQMCFCLHARPENWSKVKTLKLHYFAHDIEAEIKNCEETIQEKQRRLVELREKMSYLCRLKTKEDAIISKA